MIDPLIDKIDQGGILYDAHPGGWTHPSHNSYLALQWVLPWRCHAVVRKNLEKWESEHG